MNIKELRVSRLRQLVSADGGITEFVRKRSQPGADKPIDPTYVSQLLNGHRSFGEKAAETMCRRAGLGDGYFDREAIENSTHVITNISGESLSDRLIWRMGFMKKRGYQKAYQAYHDQKKDVITDECGQCIHAVPYKVSEAAHSLLNVLSIR